MRINELIVELQEIAKIVPNAKIVVQDKYREPDPDDEYDVDCYNVIKVKCFGGTVYMSVDWEPTEIE